MLDTYFRTYGLRPVRGPPGSGGAPRRLLHLFYTQGITSCRNTYIIHAETHTNTYANTSKHAQASTAPYGDPPGSGGAPRRLLHLFYTQGITSCRNTYIIHAETHTNTYANTNKQARTSKQAQAQAGTSTSKQAQAQASTRTRKQARTSKHAQAQASTHKQAQHTHTHAYTHTRTPARASKHKQASPAQARRPSKQSTS